MIWSISIPRKIAEQTTSELEVEVEADTLEDAIITGANRFYERSPMDGDVFTAVIRVEIKPKRKLNLANV